MEAQNRLEITWFLKILIKLLLIFTNYIRVFHLISCLTCSQRFFLSNVKYCFSVEATLEVADASALWISIVLLLTFSYKAFWDTRTTKVLIEMENRSILSGTGISPHLVELLWMIHNFWVSIDESYLQRAALTPTRTLHLPEISSELTKETKEFSYTRVNDKKIFAIQCLLTLQLLLSKYLWILTALRSFLWLKY